MRLLELIKHEMSTPEQNPFESVW